jgi:hypothetical protein
MKQECMKTTNKIGFLLIENSLHSLQGGRVVTRTFSDRRTDDRTMAAGASVTWTHCSVLFEVTWGKTAASARTRARTCVRVDARVRPRGHERVRADAEIFLFFILFLFLFLFIFINFFW